MNQVQSEQPILDFQPKEPYYQPQQPVQRGKTQTLGLDFNVAGLLCYVPFGFILAIIFLTSEPKEHRFVRFHSFQSLLLAATAIGFSIIFTIVGSILGHIPVIGWLFLLLLIPISLLVSLGFLVMAVMAIIKAYQYEMWKMPIIGNHAERLETTQSF
jgi:uncharacterized membrane protein